MLKPRRRTRRMPPRRPDGAGVLCRPRAAPDVHAGRTGVSGPSVQDDAQHRYRLVGRIADLRLRLDFAPTDRKSTRLNSSHGYISYAVFCLKKKKARNSEQKARMIV